jgi:hypothetical protein
MGASTTPGSGVVVLTDCTLSGNSATGGNGDTDGGGAGSGFGGAIFSADGSVTLNDDTVAANAVAAGTPGTGGAAGRADGGAVYNLAFGNVIQTGSPTTAALTLDNNILAQTTGGNDLASDNLAGTFGNTATVGGGIDLVQSHDFTGTTVAAGFAPFAADPQLGPLQDNGGPTATMAIKTTSPAFAAGNAALAGVPTTDQRGAPRVVGGQLDLGAFQVQAGTPAVANVGVTFGPGSQTVTLSATVTAADAAGTSVPVNEGSVTFSVAGQSATALVSNGSARAAVTLPAGLAPGDYALGAAFQDGAPDSYRNATGTATLSVSPLSTTVTITSVSTSFSGFRQKDVVTARVTDADGNPVPSGQVTLTDGGKSQTVNVSDGTATAVFRFSIFAGLGGAHGVGAGYHNATGGFTDSGASATAAGNLLAYLFQLDLDLVFLRALANGTGA